MDPFTPIKNFLNDHFFFPKVDQSELDHRLQQVRKHLPIPIIWLLGKTQSGKTSLIQALTSSTYAEIGDGIRPCTRTANLYDFPDADHCFVRFLDTRGIGEFEYDPTEDMNLYQKQSHILIVVIKAMDHAQQSILEPLKIILKAHPHWPVIVAQTALHEGYPQYETPHILPYPYHEATWPETLPQELVRSLLKQRELFKGIHTHCIPVDFTLPEDGYTPQFYGINFLWDTIEKVLPMGLRAMMQETAKARKEFQNVYHKAAHPHIVAYALAAGGAGLIPVPFVDIPVISGIQIKMFQTLASLYNKEFNTQRLIEIIGAMGLGFAASLGGRELTKLVPGYGSAISSAYAAATTYALGKTLGVYFSSALDDVELPDKLAFQKLYAEQFEEGRTLLKKYLFSTREKVKELGEDEMGEP